MVYGDTGYVIYYLILMWGITELGNITGKRHICSTPYNLLTRGEDGWCVGYI